jgi:hypothetical protein
VVEKAPAQEVKDKIKILHFAIDSNKIFNLFNHIYIILYIVNFYKFFNHKLNQVLY